MSKLESIISLVLEFLAEHRVDLHGQRVLVALSGGSDSVGALAIMSSLTSRLSPPVEILAAHVDHRLRDSSTEDEQMARHVAELLKVPYRSFTLEANTPLSERTESGSLQKDRLSPLERSAGNVEETARNARYRALIRIAQQEHCAYLVTAHHADDNLETFFIHLLRGSGLTGLAAIPPVSQRGDLTILRPFLSLSRDDLRDVREQLGLPYCVDPTNAELMFLRNRIRHRLIPQLVAFAPKGNLRPILRSIQLLREERSAVELAVEHQIERIPRQVAFGVSRLCRRHLKELPEGILFHVLRYLLKPTEHTHTETRPHGSAHDAYHPPRLLDIQRIASAIRTADRLVQIQLSGRQLYVDSTSLWLGKPTFGPPHSQLIDHVGQYDLLEQFGIILEVAEATAQQALDEVHGHCKLERSRVYLDASKLSHPLEVRALMPSEKIQPLGSQNRSSIRKFLADAKVSPLLRDSYPLVCHGPDVVWICGIRRGVCLLVGSESQRVLRLTVTNHVLGM